MGVSKQSTTWQMVNAATTHDDGLAVAHSHAPRKNEFSVTNAVVCVLRDRVSMAVEHRARGKPSVGRYSEKVIWVVVMVGGAASDSRAIPMI
ncbi:MAG TPA: hypothetical protein PKW66_00410 [Polyangiaceae bacterium]|jgi:ketosteroid isomerase-like protein|nr:hypothetical protein [Polyangiaceae bacterium]